MRILVVANEHQVIQTLKKILNGIDAELEIVGSTTDAHDVFEQVIREKSPDLILINKNVDVNNRSYSMGNDLNTTVTFSTPVKEYTFGAFHIRKKQDETSSKASVSNYTQFIEPFSPAFASPNAPFINRELNGEQPKIFRKRFLVKQGQKFLSIDITQVAFFFSEDRFIFLKTNNNHKYLVEYRIEELEEMLDPDVFYRVNRSFLIAIHAVDQVHSHHGNRLKLYLNPTPEKEVIVSRERVHDFRIWLGE